jgi:hypothetical protein
MDALDKRTAHSVRLHERFSPAIYEVNCYMLTLDVAPKAGAEMRLGQVFPGKEFVEALLADGRLRENEGPIVIYLRDDAPEHAGRRDGDAVISKWGAGGTHIWRHALWDVPDSYGDVARFFAPLPTAVELYGRWAADRGL